MQITSDGKQDAWYAIWTRRRLSEQTIQLCNEEIRDLAYT
jgi:hypothetical protein